MRRNRTKTAIAAAFRQLLTDHPIDKITVRMITDAVGCSRKTFYYYFTDVYDLTRYICSRQIDDFLEHHNDVENMREGFLKVLRFFRSDRQVILNMYHGYGKEELERFVLKAIIESARRFISAMPESRGVPEEDLDAVVRVISYMFFGILVEWTGAEMPEDNHYLKTMDTALTTLPRTLKSLSTQP